MTFGKIFGIVLKVILAIVLIKVLFWMVVGCSVAFMLGAGA